MVRVARVAMAGCSLLALAACAKATGAATSTAIPSTTLTPSSTTAAPSTTGAPTTTLSTQAKDEADIRALHDRFFRMIVLTGNPPDPHHPEIAATTTGIQRQRSQEALRQLQLEGRRFEATWKHHVTSISFSGPDNAEVLDCAEESSRLLGADGAVIGTTENRARVTSTHVVRTDDGWRIDDWLTGGDQVCVV